MVLSRYRYHMDEYAREELKAHLASLSPQQRIEFVKAIGPKAALKEILAADESIAVRAWAARTLGFDIFKEDKDPLVRAAWWEYGQGFLNDEDTIREFSKLSSLERLGWIRSENFPRILLEAIFDLKTNRFSLSDDERCLLIYAFLSGARYPVASRESTFLGSDYGLGDRIWQYASDWPMPLYKEIIELIFKHVEASDEARVTLFTTLKDRDLRLAIVRSASSDSKCLKIALDDDDAYIRGLAWERYSFPPEEWRSALEGSDLAALRGLCRNETLSATVRYRTAGKRLHELEGESSVMFLMMLGDKAQKEQEDLQQHERSVEARLEVLQESVNRNRFGIGIIMLVIVFVAFAWVTVAVVTSLL
jgi:hypothetical protein